MAKDQRNMRINKLAIIIFVVLGLVRWQEGQTFSFATESELKLVAPNVIVKVAAGSTADSITVNEDHLLVSIPKDATFTLTSEERLLTIQQTSGVAVTCQEGISKLTAAPSINISNLKISVGSAKCGNTTNPQNPEPPSSNVLPKGNFDEVTHDNNSWLEL